MSLEQKFEFFAPIWRVMVRHSGACMAASGNAPRWVSGSCTDMKWQLYALPTCLPAFNPIRPTAHPRSATPT